MKKRKQICFAVPNSTSTALNFSQAATVLVCSSSLTSID